MTKRDYYRKSHWDCPCCGWRCHKNYRKWLHQKKFGFSVKELFQ